MNYDYLIVGAGLSGAVFAQTLAQAGHKVLILEKRSHIGGNCFDCVDTAGVMIHRYGAHIFHTEFEDVWQYLSGFTRWRPYSHRVVCFVEGRYIPIPFNYYSLQEAFDGKAAAIQCLLEQKYGRQTKLSVLDILHSQEPMLGNLAVYIYDKIFKNYTAKQWGIRVDEISPDVIARVPIYTDYDNRYFTDTYQAVPADGYTAMIQALLSDPHIELRLNTPFESVCQFTDGIIRLDGQRFNGILIYTGRPDALFGYRFGLLPYRSVHFEFETFAQSYYQHAPVINYPNDYNYTRIVEFKYLTGQKCPNTTICREYPRPCQTQADEPYYPILTPASVRLYQLYAEQARQYDNLILAGRLGRFQYVDMDDAVKNALDAARTLLQCRV
ncbi:MAG TPA: UDP-galactopyranose mutase [Anaerohalosphaeraceae bacterium]|nr:UDP-galactopyranose mutase [Anaerohalosphaeraceae bacterium]HOM75224.1 UDP-galactopyranose mutase [Anaerohalosphaeraceae bacterium]HPC63983.1 UDP-galactopyranose mutase [Anaerohalosphaeraceae bacterium]HRS70923.1 UDP-galactopyranose mutase [Anaerohalosphaeraceae bacterium]HRV20151.1 UDP-galactopyranose mutase [Anaerohalosphaeraceae bacterium]